jgi:hypothetical protein
MLMKLEARLHTSATLFNFGNRTPPILLMRREESLYLLLCRSGSAEQLSLLCAPVFAISRNNQQDATL